MKNLDEVMKQRLSNATKILVFGVGSDLRGDDGAGLLVADYLEKASSPKLAVIKGGTAPENFTGEIKRQKPSHLVIVDAVDMGKPAGFIDTIEPDKIGGYSFSTHSLPLKVLVDFLQKDLNCSIFVIGIQPADISFGALLSAEVEAAAKVVAESIASVL